MNKIWYRNNNTKKWANGNFPLVLRAITLNNTEKITETTKTTNIVQYPKSKKYDPTILANEFTSSDVKKRSVIRPVSLSSSGNRYEKLSFPPNA